MKKISPLSLAKVISVANFILFVSISILSILGLPGFGGRNTFEEIGTALLFAGFAFIGALICLRRSENPIGWVFCALVLVFLIERSASNFGAYILRYHSGAIPYGQWAAWITSWIGTFTFAILMTFPFLLFPTGKFLSSRWRVVAWFAILNVIVQVIFQMLQPGPISDFPEVHNPLGIDSLAGITASGIKICAFLGGVSIGLSALSLVFRYHRSQGVERLQIKWIAYGTALPVIIAFVITILFPNLESSGLLLATIFNVLFFLAVLAMPVTIGIAILRYRLWDIEIIIRRTLVYGTLTLILAGIYAGGVLLFQGVFQLLTGISQSPVATVLSTLVIAIVFNPLRKRIQNMIDRRFYRRKYNAEQIVDRFSEYARQKVELDQLREHMLRIVGETLQPAHVSIWLREDPPAKEVIPQ